MNTSERLYVYFCCKNGGAKALSSDLLCNDVQSESLLNSASGAVERLPSGKLAGILTYFRGKVNTKFSLVRPPEATATKNENAHLKTRSKSYKGGFDIASKITAVLAEEKES